VGRRRGFKLGGLRGVINDYDHRPSQLKGSSIKEVGEEETKSTVSARNKKKRKRRENELSAKQGKKKWRFTQPPMSSGGDLGEDRARKKIVNTMRRGLEKEDQERLDLPEFGSLKARTRRKEGD